MFHSYVSLLKGITNHSGPYPQRRSPMLASSPIFAAVFFTLLSSKSTGILHVSIIFTSDSIMLHFSHDVPYIESKYDILWFFITEGYISATPSNNPYKGLIMIVLCYMFFHYVIYFLPSYYIIAEGSKSAALQTKPRIRENQKFTSRTLPQLRGGLLKTRGCFT